MDAGWYKNEGDGWPKVGTWEVDDERFPGGLRAISDRCHASGIELLVWFEVERVHPGSWLANNRPEWVFGGTGGGLVRMDEPDAVDWLIDRVDRIISAGGIDFYRSDFNIDPLPSWRANDAEDRQGITEIRYIEGYLRYWDELQRRHPGMPIDSCASGGRRNDLETMRRAVPLLRSDFEGDDEGNQCHTFGYAPWLPYYGAVHNWGKETYRFRSAMAPFVQRNWDVRDDALDIEWAKRFLDEWRSVADGYLGDFYPLSDCSTSDDAWVAWQFDRPDLMSGLVQAFRRSASIDVSVRYRLRGLDPDANYVVSDQDADGTQEISGRELMDTGLRVTLSEQPGAAIVTYRRTDA
jgi:alpha-galactosidase